MNKSGNLDKAEELKSKIMQNIGVNDEIVCSICDELILYAQKQNDLQSIAFGYVWRADYFFYVKSDIQNFGKELSVAQKYIDEQAPTDLLEKYYTLKHLFYESLYDTHSAVEYCLQALGVAEKLDIKHRIAANYGTIGSYFADYECYQEALQYSSKSLEILYSLEDAKPRIMRVLLCNIINIYIKLDNLEMAKHSIEELSTLQLNAQDLKIYVDYSFLLYYSKVQDSQESLYYLQQLLDDGLMEFGNRVYVAEILKNAVEAMLFINNKEKAKQFIELLQNAITENVGGILSTLCKLKIQYSQQFENKKETSKYYREYYDVYIKDREQVSQLKREALRIQIKLNDIYLEEKLSKATLNELNLIANYDELTNVYSRRYMDIKQNEIISETETAYIGFAIFDIDYFKEYNDYYGHLAGDDILKQVANCLQEHTTEQIKIFRYGGDEFVSIAWNIDCEKLKEYVMQIKEGLYKKAIPHGYSRCSNQITLSIGYGCAEVKTKFEATLLFEQVDEALYKAKNSGRNSVKSIENQDLAKGDFDA